MAFFPLHDDNPRILIGKPWVTWTLIASCVLVYWWQSSVGPREQEAMIYALGVIPVTLAGEAELSAEIALVPTWFTLVTYQFLHGGLMHLIGNMLYLWVFGDNIEDAMGHGRFLAFYLLCGVLSGLAHVAANLGSEVPVIGASGAVSGILGAYLILHPRARILVPIIVIPLYVPAYLLLVAWIGFQVLSAAGDSGGQGGVAWWAHIGGFAIGALLIAPFRHKAIPLFGGDIYPRGMKIRTRRKPPGDGDAGPRGGPWQ